MRSAVRRQGRELVFDLLVASGWTLYAAAYLVRAISGEGFVDLELLVFFTVLVVLFLLRHPAQRTGVLWESLLAFAGTILPPVMLRSVPGGLRWLGEPIEIIGGLGMIAAAISLGRSFGIAPADRGLQTKGLYRWLRHPLYAAEMCFYIGYLVANPTWRNLSGLTASAAIQLARIAREERILEGYVVYAQRVRWRLIPFVW